MPDLLEGETIEMKGSGAKPYVIKNCGIGGYSCTCPAWRNQSLDPALRTCKHIIKLRGEAAEQARIGAAAALPSRKPEDKEGKEGPPVLLAETWDADTNLVGWWMSEKLDGVRAYWDGTRFLSRQGNLYLAPAWFTAALPAVPLDGELWIGRKAFQRTVSIARQQTGGEQWRELCYVVFDAPAHGGEFEARLRFLDDLLGKRSLEFAQVMEHQQCRSMDQLRAEADRIAGLGGEGLMLRQPGSRYVAGRSSTLLKVKRFHDDEARVVGHEPGKGRHEGRMGAVLVERLSDGKQFAVGTGFSDVERSAPPPLGSVIRFRFQELTDAGVPRFPSYLGLRGDAALTPPARTPAPKKAPVKAAVVAAPLATPVRTFEYRGAGGVRVWEVAIAGTDVTLRFGAEGDLKQSKTLPFPSAAEAHAAVAELIAEKLDDGFVERGAIPAVAPKAPTLTTPPARPGGRRRFEFVAGTSNKFWEVWVEGTKMYTQYGRIGSGGQTTVKDYPNEAAARQAADKLIAEKTGKGYVEKG